jgi:hypothetical protein
MEVWDIRVFLLLFSLMSFEGVVAVGKRKNIVCGIGELAMIYIIISISINRILEYLL